MNWDTRLQPKKGGGVGAEHLQYIEARERQQFLAAGLAYRSTQS